MSQSGAYGNSGGLSSITTINGDSGSITGSTVTIYADQTALNSGATVGFVNSGTVSTFNVTDSDNNTFIGKNCGSDTFSGDSNTGLGSGCSASLSSGSSNTAVGYNALAGMTSGGNNVALGTQAIQTASLGDNNTIVGFESLFSATNASNNVSLGYAALYSLLTGGQNLALGTNAGSNYTGAESNNILLNSLGTASESNVLRIGAGTGSGTQQLSSAYISGINGVNVSSSTARVVSMTSGSDQLGTATITAGTGITVTPSANTITISTSGTTNYTYTNVNNAASPYTVLSTDEYISVDTSGGVVSLLFPNAATSGRTYIVKDRTGTAAASNITITTVGGAVNIDGATTYVINNNYGSVQLMGNSSTYELF